MAPENKLSLIKGHCPQGSELPVRLVHSPRSSALPAKPLLCCLPLPTNKVWVCGLQFLPQTVLPPPQGFAPGIPLV